MQAETTASQLFLPRRTRTGAEKGSLAVLTWQTFLSFCIISALRLQGSEHKPVQSHCSRSPLAHGRAITLLGSCCSQDRAAAPLQPSGSSNPLLQHTPTRFCLPQQGNLTTAKLWQRACTAREVGPRLLNSWTQLTLLHTAFNKPNPGSLHHLQSTGTLNPPLRLS